MIKRISSGLLYLGILIAILGCGPGEVDSQIEKSPENSLISKALEQVKLAVANNEFDIAENHFHLILTEDSEHEEAKDWLDLISKYQKLLGKIEANELDAAQSLFNELQSHKHGFSIKENLAQLEESLQPKFGTYTNEALGISFHYPKSWLGRIEISDVMKGGYSETEIYFTYIDTSKKIKQYVFSIVVYDEILDESYWSMQRYIADDGVNTYALAFAGEVNEELYRPGNEKDLEFVQNMIEEVDMIVDTFELEQKEDVVENEQKEETIEEDESNVVYADYVNERFGFSFQYPKDLTMSRPPDNGDGVNLYNDDFEVIAYGGHTNVVDFDETIEDYYEADVSNIEEIAYERLSEDWYVLSYEENGSIVYKKFFFGDRVHNTLFITYAASEQDKYGPITTQIVDSFNSSAY